MIRGSCLCGGVTWEAAGPLDQMVHCHCSMCRKAHGAAFATYVAAPAEGFRWLEGEEQVRRYEASPGTWRPFCSRCGSVVPWPPGDGWVFMPAGNLDDDPGVRPTAHIFVASKAGWHEIADEIPRFDAYPPGWPDAVVEREPAPPASRGGALRGSCLCGGVVYEVSGELQGIVKCHCNRCRKARSAAHGANLFIRNPDLQWLTGADLVRSYKLPDADRFANHFCERCGSLVPRREPDPELLAVPAGSLDSEAGVSEKIHIFTSWKAPWFEIRDGLPQLEESV
jgi:hypothetical protein